MSAQKQESASDRLARYQSALAEAYADADAITASELATIVERDAKVVRARLRAIQYRNADEKHNRHAVDQTTANAIAEHFASAKRVS